MFLFKRKQEPKHFGDLRKVALFSSLKAHEVHTLDDLLHQRVYLQNEVIFDQHEEGQAIYFILSGLVGVYKDGHSQAVAVLTEGQFFGELALINGAPRNAQARANTDCNVAVLFREDFFNLLKTHPEIARKISQHCQILSATQSQADAEDALMTAFVRSTDTPSPQVWVLIIAITCVTLFLFQKMLWLIVPFLLALILFYLLQPVATRLTQLGISRLFTAISLSSAFLLLIGLNIALFYPLAISNVGVWQSHLNGYVAGGAKLIQFILQALKNQFHFLQHADFGQSIYQQFFELTSKFSEQHFGTLLMGLSSWLPSLLLAPVITFFMLKDGADLRKIIGGAVPNAFFEKTLYLMYSLNKTAKLYLTGMLKIAGIDIIILSIGLLLLGVSYPIALALISAILAWIPYLGPLLGCGLTLIVASTDMPNQVSIIYAIMGLYLLVRVLDDFVFLPMVVGKSLRIHPLLTLLMFLVGETIAGVTGLMLVIPVLAIYMVLGETIEMILTDLRLQARHKSATKKRWRVANRDLERLD